MNCIKQVPLTNCCVPSLVLRQVLNQGKRAVLSESNTAMVDQLVSIVQHVVDNNAEGMDGGGLQTLIHVNMDETVLNFIT